MKIARSLSLCQAKDIMSTVFNRLQFSFILEQQTY